MAFALCEVAFKCPTVGKMSSLMIKHQRDLFYVRCEAQSRLLSDDTTHRKADFFFKNDICLARVANKCLDLSMDQRPVCIKGGKVRHCAMESSSTQGAGAAAGDDRPVTTKSFHDGQLNASI